jgi:drug/metabolite transporter (DMT)-like permease
MGNVPASAVAAALCAAVVHATWNLAVARAEDTEGRMRAGSVWACALLVPVALLTWGAEAAAIPFMAASALAHLVYFTALGRAYRTNDVDLVYAVSRGTGPVLVLAVSVIALSEHISLQAAAGVVAVAGGVLALKASGHATREAVLWGLAIGVTIAGYTLLDAEGVERAEPISFLLVVLVPLALLNLALLHRSGDMRAQLARPAGAAVGAGMITAYVLVLWALQRAPAPGVAALRETSIVIVAAAAGLGGARRVAGAAIVLAGVVLIVTG